MIIGMLFGVLFVMLFLGVPIAICLGTAIRVKLSAWVNILWATAGSRFRFPLATIATHTAIPRQIILL